MTTNMTDAAIKNDRELGNALIPVKEIFCDHEFNCRGWFSPVTCIELAKDIAQKGLQQPIVVRELRTEDKPGFPKDVEALEKGCKYKIIAGHRRWTAYIINEASVIPAIIKSGETTEWEEKDINAVENLQRADLNFLQEANAIRHYWMAGWPRQDIADRIGKSAGWVQIRVILLEMPPEVQEAAGQGYIKPGDMHALNKFSKNPNELLKRAGILRDKRATGEGRDILHVIKEKDRPDSKKIRGKREMFDMMEHIRLTLMAGNKEEFADVDKMITPGGNCLATRALAWACGEITTLEIHQDLQEFCETVGLKYVIPQFEDALEEDLAAI